MYSENTNTVTFNKSRVKDVHKFYGSYKNYGESQVKDGWLTQPNMFLHELGHYLDHYFGKEQPDNRIGDLFSRLDEKKVEADVSGYAATSKAEFMAEIYSGILYGKVYPEEYLKAANLDYYTKVEIAQHMLSMASGEVPNTNALQQQWGDMIHAVYTEGGASFKIELLANPEVEKFIDTHAQVLDNAFVNTEMSDSMRARLKDSDWMFSGMKTFHELNEAFPSLLDKDGNRKPFDQFLKDVQTIDQTYNRNYLSAEYNFAQASAEMAAKWENYAEDGDDYLLQYRTAGDDKVRPEHAELNGVTLPQSDSFWDTYYPPNGWNCRCTVVQVLKDEYEQTPHDEAMQRGSRAMANEKTAKMFAFNPGKQEQTFPDYNPYTISKCAACDKRNLSLAFRGGATDSELCSACQFLVECRKDNGYYLDPKAGERLKISYHADVDELNDNISAARDLLTSIPSSVVEIRPHSNVPGVKNPEYLINGVIADRKGVEGYDGIISGFRSAITQGCHAVYIDLDAHLSSMPLNVSRLTSKIYGRHADFEKGIMESCFVRYHGKVVEIPKTVFSKNTTQTKEGIADILEKIKG